MKAKRVLAAALAAVASCAALAADGELGSRRLRGYGKTEAVLDGDTVTVKAESAAKAGLWAARYLYVNAKEGRVVKPGVVKLPDGTFTQVRVDGKKVKIRHSVAEPAAALDTRLPKIPMFLNAWDDWCFRFYYWAGQTPPGVEWRKYDPAAEFDYAKEHGCGFVFWDAAHVNTWAKGMMEDGWSWAYRLAKDRGLPIVLNTDFAVPNWLANEFRDENETHAPQYAGCYHSVGEPGLAGPFISWASEKARRVGLGALQNAVKKYDCDNVIEILEPHGELNHGDYTVFIEHGPLADASYRKYLKERYGSPKTVAKRWQDPKIKSWDDCTLPEIADFAGWGPDATDLSGAWRGHPLEAEDGSEYPGGQGQRGDQKKFKRAPAEWLQPEFDDSAWPIRYGQMPGSDITMFADKRPALLRRRFTLAEKPGRTWLYVWDLSQAWGSVVAAHVNGKKAVEEHVQHPVSHWMVCEVTDLLKAGENVLALELPHGVLNYRIYLTREEPRYYPYFGPAKNAKWADFCGWQEWSRMRAVQTGLELHRAVEPDKNIVAMSPGAYFDSMLELAKRYGSRFHDTGMTAACYWEFLPMLMRSAGMPFSCEPGGPAGSLREFRHFFSLYLREGVNAVHYFIHIGAILWNDEIRAEFERILPAIRMMGRMHLAKPEMALVMDSRIDALMGYPWRKDPNSAFSSGYSDWRFNERLKVRFQLDAVTPDAILAGDADQYRYLIDCNNTVMTPETVKGIERYVRAGGTYVAMFETGRHTPEEPDRWVLSELAGCRVKERIPMHVEQRDWGVSVEPDRVLEAQRTVDGAWRGLKGEPLLDGFRTNGTLLEPVADDVEVLYRWKDGPDGAPGSAAVTVRKVGKGNVVVMGPHTRFWCAETIILERILLALGAKELPIVAPENCHVRHYETNDGLQDVWLVANERGDRDAPYEIVFRDGVKRELTDVLTGKPAELKGTLGPECFVMATSPRSSADQALGAWHWVENQFGWWRGGEKSPEKLAKAPEHPDVLDLGSGEWTLAGASGASRKVALGPMVVGLDLGEGDTAYTCEREFTVPRDWKDSDIELWCVGLYSGMFCEARYKVLLDGKDLEAVHDGVCGFVMPLKPGDRARLAFEVKDDNHPRIRGFKGVCFLYRRPHPKGEFALDGEWETYPQVNDPNPGKATLPGKYENSAALRRKLVLPASLKGKRVSIDFTSKGDFLHGVIVNGHYLRRHHHRHGIRTVLDITPWLKPGEENEIWIVGNHNQGWARQGEIPQIRLVW